MDWFFLAATSAILTAAATIFEKKSLFTLSAVDFSYRLGWLNLVLSIPFFFMLQSAPLTAASLGVLFFKSILTASAFLLIMESIKNLQISRALPLLALTPGFVAFFAFVFIGEALSINEWVGVGLLIVGIYLLETKGGQALLDPLKVYRNSKHHHYLIIAMLLMTVASILDKVLLKDFKLPPVAFMAFQHLFYALIFTVVMLVKKEKLSGVFKYDTKALFLSVLFVAVCTIGYRLTQIEAVKIAPVALVLSIKRTSVFFATVIGGRIFRDENLIRKSIAAAILVAGAILLLQGNPAAGG